MYRNRQRQAVESIARRREISRRHRLTDNEGQGANVESFLTIRGGRIHSFDVFFPNSFPNVDSENVLGSSVVRGRRRGRPAPGAVLAEALIQQYSSKT